MSELEQILSRSRDPGQLVERRKFTLARDKALEKLRSFALRHPRQYVLELVQCAVFAGASWIAVDVDHDRMVLAWVGGRPLQEAELANIFDYLFASRTNEEHRHLVQLAIGVNAILDRRARTVRIESGDGTVEGTLRVDLDRKGRGVVGRPQTPMAGTYVLAEFGPNWLARLAGDTHTEEEALVEERCRYTPVPILLNGRAPFGYKPSTDIRMYGTGEYEVFSGAGRRGFVRAPVPGVASEGFQIVVGGVRVCTMELPQLGTVDEHLGIRLPMVSSGLLSGVICDDRLRKTADQADIVRDRRFIDMLAAVQGPATRLVQRVVKRGYEPPRLPAPEVDEGEEQVEALELPTQLPQVPPRVPLTHAELDAIDPESPLFWVRRDDLDKVDEAVAPHRFPYPVLVLEPGHLHTFDQRFPGRALARFTNAGDVEFVRRALERGVRQRQATVAVAPGASLTLTLRLQGPRVRFGAQEDDTVPLCILRPDGRERLRAPELALPNVSAVLRLTEHAPRPSPEDEAAWILAHAWRLLPTELSGAVEPAVHGLAVALLSAHARPHFVREPAGLRLELGLPGEWGALREGLRELALAMTPTGPLTLPRWLSLAGTPHTVQLTEPEALLPLQRLELRIGVGHLLADPLHTPLVAVARLEEGWRVFSPDAIGPVDDVLWIDATLAPRPPEGRTLVPTPVPGLGRVAAEPEADWRDGALVLLDELLRRLHADELGEAGLLPDRVRARLRLAALQLGAHLGGVEDLPLLGLPGSGEPTTWRVLAERGVQVLPRHGLAADEGDVCELTFDELAVLESAVGPLPLRIDDPPSLWDSLTVPEHPNWLLRQEVQAPGLSGWLGLRVPFDHTVAIVLRSHGHEVVLPGAPGLACHGMLWLETSQRQLSTHQLELLRLARHQLLHQLTRLVEAPPDDPEHARALRRYAMLYVLEQPDSVLATRIAPELTVFAPDGRRWGTLSSWLAHPPAERPPLPVTARRPPPSAPDAPPDVLESWANRLQAATEGLLGHWEIELRVGPNLPNGGPIRLRTWQGTVVRIELNPSDPTVQKAQSGISRAVELVLLEAARKLATFARGHRLQLDLGQVQRVLVAQRLG